MAELADTGVILTADDDADDDFTQDEISDAWQEFEDSHIDTNTMVVEEDGDYKEILHYDEAEDRFHLEIVQDVEGVLEWCKSRYNEGLVNKHCEFRLVGSYPHTILELFARKNGIQPRTIQSLLAKDRNLTTRLLNDPDLAGFRTLAGRY